MRKYLSAVAVVSCLYILGCTQQPGPATNPSQAPSAFGQEAHRFVYEKDEIVSVLRNGMTVIVKRIPSPVVSVRGTVGAGSLYEKKWLGGGLSHLLEHLVAGGTNGRRSEAENRNLLQQLGNNSNAFTSLDNTTYFVNTTPEHMEQAVDLVSGWMLTAQIPEAEFEREREVVQRELEMDRGSAEWVFGDMVEATRYRLNPARMPIIGYKAVIAGLTRDDVYAYYRMAYQPNNITFVVTGNLDPEEMLAAVRKHVGDVPHGRDFSHNITPEPAVIAPRTAVAAFARLGLAQLDLGFPTVRLQSDDMYPLDLLAYVLGRGESSILVQELRDKQKLIASVNASDETPFFVDGTLRITMTLEAAKIPEATAAALAELEKIKKDGVSEDRLGRAKAQMVSARYFGQQTAEDIAAALAYDWLSAGDPHFSDRYVERLQKVTAAQVKQVAAKYIDHSRLITTALVPEEADENAPATRAATASATQPSALARATDLLRAAAPATRPRAVQAASGVQRVQLKNGTIVLLKRIGTSPIVSIKCYSLGGLTTEDASTNGLGNLAMLTSLRGTKTRSARQIAEFFDSIGGAMSASCQSSMWVWEAGCLKGDFARTLEVYSDLLHAPAFPESELNSIRKRVLGQIASQDANWDVAAMRFFRASYFGPMNSPYQFMPIGLEENVKSFTAVQLRDWYYKTILPSRRIVAIFGDIDLGKAKALAEAQFGHDRAPGGPAPAPPTQAVVPATAQAPGTPSISVTRVEVKKSDNEEAGIYIGFKSDSVAGQPWRPALIVADTMCSGYGYPTGYIFETLRGKGLVYDANAYDFPGINSTKPGCFIAYAGCDPKNVNEVVETILLNIARMQGTPEDIKIDWFERSKKLIVTADAMDHETAGAQAETAAVNELFGLGYDFHQHFADRINAVQLSNVQAVVRARLRECVVTIATSAPELVGVKPGERTYNSFPPVDLTPRGVRHDTPK